MAEINVTMEQTEERLKKMEYSLGLNRRTKPQAFVDIDDNFAEIKKNFEQKI